MWPFKKKTNVDPKKIIQEIDQAMETLMPHSAYESFMKIAKPILDKHGVCDPKKIKDIEFIWRRFTPNDYFKPAFCDHCGTKKPYREMHRVGTKHMCREHIVSWIGNGTVEDSLQLTALRAVDQFSINLNMNKLCLHICARDFQTLADELGIGRAKEQLITMPFSFPESDHSIIPYVVVLDSTVDPGTTVIYAQGEDMNGVIGYGRIED